MPARYQPLLLAELATRLAEVRARLLESERERAADLEQVPPRERDSARNLVHYLALRRFDLRPLQRQLTALGLSSLGRCESQVLPSVDAVLAALHRLAGRDWSLETPAAGPPALPGDPGNLERRTIELLGPARTGRPSRIMVTMPSTAASDPGLVAGLVEAGMDVARINSAHDDITTWTAIARHVREASARAGRPCRILFDLSGPKLRTAEFGAGAAVLRVRPRRDTRGLVIEPGWLRLVAEPPVPGTAGIVPVLDPDWLALARPGDLVEVEEPVGRRRRLEVLQAGEGELLCTCLRGVRLESGRPLRLLREGREVAVTKVGPLARIPDRLRVYPGDELLLGNESLAPAAPARDERGRRAGPLQVPTTLGSALGQVLPGDPVWFDDGRIGGVVTERGPGTLRVRIDSAPAGGAPLGSDKGINLPNTRLDLPRPTARDIHDLEFAVHWADMVGFSFVEQPADVLRLEDLLAARGGEHLGIVLKIETRRAFEALPQLLLTGLRSPPLGVMLARGDLAVEVGFARLAEVQEQILWLCEAAQVPVIWATQVLETLAKTGRPTRSEVSDAAMAVSAECVMLNKGPFIGDAVRMLDDVLRRMQEHHSKKRSMLRRLRSFD
ncbi:MAG: pyruvate kinase [Chromatiales bacterium]|nr:pyruvate kinase [Chromatiales bacterium]